MAAENIRQLITLLWFLVNLTMVGFLITSFFVGGRVPLGICILENNNTSPTFAPTMNNGSDSATSAPLYNSSDDGEDPYGPRFYDDGNAGFVMMWSTFLLVSLSIGGTMVLKSCRTPFAVGGFAGVVLVMANLMFLLAATSAGELRRRTRLNVDTGSDEAILGFSVIEFLLLSAFGIVLVRHKDDVLDVKPGVDEMMDPRAFEATVQGARGI